MLPQTPASGFMYRSNRRSFRRALRRVWMTMRRSIDHAAGAYPRVRNQSMAERRAG
jgi:hypothetical protein